MSLATRVRWYLDTHHIDYEVLHHEHSSSSLGSAREAHLPPGRVAKCVLLEDERGYVLAVLPAACRLSLGAIRELLGRRMELATEGEVGELFADCEVGAIPPMGPAYNLPMLVDDSLLRMPDVYFEAGDHEDLVHVEGRAFRDLMQTARHGKVARPN